MLGQNFRRLVRNQGIAPWLDDALRVLFSNYVAEILMKQIYQETFHGGNNHKKSIQVLS